MTRTPGGSRSAAAWILSSRTGAAAATVLRAAARDLRSTRRRRARVAANSLGVRLVVPLGLTTLPAFLLWAVAPVALGLAHETLDRWLTGSALVHNGRPQTPLCRSHGPQSRVGMAMGRPGRRRWQYRSDAGLITHRTTHTQEIS